MRVTIRTSPACKNSRTVRSASRPWVVVPLRFSARITSQPAVRSAASASIIRDAGFVPVEESAPENTLFPFFFSGHGVNLDGMEYIIPRLPPGLKGPEDIQNSAVSVNWLTETLERSAGWRPRCGWNFARRSLRKTDP
jgi:hypothetical protein